MTVPGGEMPFLDHLEELRTRLLRALGAIVVGFGAGLWLVEKLQLVALLKAPIAQYLPSGKLTFTSPTEPLMIVFKLGFVVGLLLMCFGMYGRVSGRLPHDNPYWQARHPERAAEERRLREDAAARQHTLKQRSDARTPGEFPPHS